jgi:squalene-hopene/tetraprenyl-beta-curcumene cyclase
VTVVQELSGLDTAVEQGAERLLSLQHPDGWWKGELESNATMIAEHLFLLHFLGLRDAETDRLLANELLARRRNDGTWSIWFEGPPDLSVTVEAYTALKLAGVDAGDATRDYIRRSGGIARARIFTRAFLAVIGQWPWRRLAHVPVELILLPANGPLSVYDFSCWARQTMVSLSVVEALRPVRPSAIDLSEIGGQKVDGSARPRLSKLRRHAVAVAERWVRERQEADGSWGGIQPPWVWSLIMLAALGHGFEDETFARGLAGWERFMVRDGDRLRPEACQSPIWDTALAVLALRAAGVSADDPRLQAAGSWLLAEEVTVRGDWSIRRPELEPGGWSFEFDNDFYPDVDDTAVVALALRELELGDDAVRRGLDWMVGMQSRSGGWGAFDADNEALWLYKLPICDFGKVTDEPSADVTAHALEALGREDGYGSSLAAGLDWLLAEQEPDGSWFGRWGVNHLYGTGAALPALEACGLPPDHPAIRRAVTWLDSVQQPSGAFGENILSYRDAKSRGRGAATASQTAWALLGYVAGGSAAGLSTRRSAEYLCQTQRPDGDWDEQHYTGTGFPLDFMIRYHLYRLTFPLLALGRLRERLNG